MHVGRAAWRDVLVTPAHTVAVAFPLIVPGGSGLSKWFRSSRDASGACDTTRTTALPADAARESEPSNCGRNCVSCPNCKRKKPATYAVPTACCCFAVSRPGYFAPQGDAFSSPDQSSFDGATDCPGVHSVLKKLWLAPI